MEMPKKLYKYEPFSDLTLRNLKRQSIYFSNPRGFNDPYDCAITAEIQDLTDEQLEDWKKYFLNNAPVEAKNELVHYSNHELREKLKTIVSDVIAVEKEKFISKCGITCLSETNDNLLMWSHYGGRYKGFCLEFDTRFEPFNKSKNVKYSENMPQINSSPLLTSKIENEFFDLFCMKAKSWEYEKEWRVFHFHSDTLYTYPRESLTAIYLGPDIEPECLEIIALIIGNQNPDVKLYRGQRSSKSFRVEFEQVNYIPHIVAKNLGLL